MGRGTRHSKNAGGYGSEGLTYHEKQALRHGTIQERLGKDAIGNFDDCKLQLRPAKDPVATPDGVIFSREAILHCLLQQKKDIKRKQAAWDEYEKATKNRETEKKWIDEQARLLEFERTQGAGLSDQSAREISEALKAEAEADRSRVTSVTAIRERNALKEGVRSFWQAGALDKRMPEAKPEKPDLETKCPITGKRLRLKDLVDVKFTVVPDADEGGAKYMDPVTKDALTNRSTLVLIKTTGDVMHKDTYTRFVAPDGVFNGKKVRPRDVIELQRGGTGFAAHDKVEGKKHTQMGVNVASFANDSKWGLKFRR